jgi:hypothetical protein
MTDWLFKNKELLFSGGGLVLFGLLARWVAKFIRLRGPIAPPFDQAVFRARPLPSDIKKVIRDAPSLRQSARAQEFVGLKVQWRTTLGSAEEKDDGTVRLYLSEGDFGPSVWCEVPADRYPDLRLAREGTTIWVAGEIAEYRAFLGLRSKILSCE